MSKIEVLNITLKRTMNIAVISVLFVAMMTTFSIPSLTDKVQAKIDAKGNSIDGPFTNIGGHFPPPGPDEICKNYLSTDCQHAHVIDQDVCGLFGDACEGIPAPPTSLPPTIIPEDCISLDPLCDIPADYSDDFCDIFRCD